ncbi:MAG: flagellar type III secretion system pore protein FliP [Planctomycetota bacterium]|nr:flagellar type III secretion system pore protein FliP [Planctomycetota bacterium]
MLRTKTILAGIFLVVFVCACPTSSHDAHAQSVVPKLPGVERAEDPDDVVATLEILFLLTILALAPSIIVMTTAFTRIVIVLSFVRRALATQELPPNQVVIGLALFLTFMVMMPTLVKIKDNALTPYMDGKITQRTAFAEAEKPMREFMLTQTRKKDIFLFLRITGGDKKLPEKPTYADIPTSVLVPAFIISELRRAFIMGFMIFLPFVIIDLVVSSTLISMGMLVLPPIMISLPFKILLFVLVDGWYLVVGSLVQSFYVT